jgi:hypothetical protein
MDELTFDDIEEIKEPTTPIKKRIRNSELNSDEPDIVINKKVIDPEQVEPIPVSPVEPFEVKEDKPVVVSRPSSPQIERPPPLQIERPPSPQIEKDEENMTDEELVQEYKYKFRMLKRNYTYIDAPPENSSLETLKRAYKRAMKEVSSDTSVQNYHMYLILGFFAVEFVSKNLIGIDISGFTVDRIKRINRYNRLLIELGEREYASIGSNWPVEVRLCVFVLVDAIIFYIVSRIVGGNTQLMEVILGTISGAPSKSTDNGGLGNIMNLFGQVMTGMQQPQQQQQQPAQTQQSKPYEMKPPTRFMKKN